jgi:hypothetical protein
MHMIRGVMAPGSGKKKPKVKTASILAAEKALRDTLARVGYKGPPNTSKRSYKHDLGVVRDATRTHSIPGNGTKKDANVYTGDEIAGIATMHKSNAVPIRRDNKQAAVDVTNMRTGG